MATTEGKVDAILKLDRMNFGSDCGTFNRMGGRKGTLTRAVAAIRGVISGDDNYISTLKPLYRKTIEQLWTILRDEIPQELHDAVTAERNKRE